MLFKVFFLYYMICFKTIFLDFFSMLDFLLTFLPASEVTEEELRIFQGSGASWRRRCFVLFGACRFGMLFFLLGGGGLTKTESLYKGCFLLKVCVLGVFFVLKGTSFFEESWVFAMGR